ncbi:MAG: hypothetical protein D6705_14825, partial [Deltaproteobacteria bacterium]
MKGGALPAEPPVPSVSVDTAVSADDPPLDEVVPEVPDVRGVAPAGVAVPDAAVAAVPVPVVAIVGAGAPVVAAGSVLPPP